MLFSWLKNKLSVRQTSVAEQQLAAIQGVGDFTTPITYKLSEQYLPQVVASIDYVASSLASLPVRLCRKDGTNKEVITEGALVRMLKDPHPQLNGMPELLLLSMYDLLAYGNCIITVDSLDEMPVLTPIPWGYVTCPYREYNAGYRVTYPGSDSVAVPSSRVIHVRIGCVDGGFIGRSPLARNSSTLSLSRLVEQATASLWQHGVHATTVFKTKKTLTPVQRSQTRKELIDEFAGANRGMPMFADQDVDIVFNNANSKNLEHLDQRMLGIVQVCMLFGVSPVLIGDLRFGTYTNYAEARKAFTHETLSRYQLLFARALTRKLLPGSPNMAIELDSSHLLQDRDSKVREIVELRKAGIIEPEEAKKELGYG